MATLLNINTISFLGGGYAHRFLPYPSSLIAKASAQHKVLYQQLPCFNCNWHCQYPLENNITWRCIANISLDDAITALSEALTMKCKICESAARLAFTTQVLSQYEVSFFKCTSCDYLFYLIHPQNLIKMTSSKPLFTIITVCYNSEKL